jgi:hypothetical protein
MGRQRILASVERTESAGVTVRVYQQDGDEVERVAWKTGHFCEREVAALLRLNSADLVPRGRPRRTRGGTGARDERVVGAEQPGRKRR